MTSRTFFLNYNSITASDPKGLKRSYEYLRFENEENLRTTSLKRDVLVLKKTEFRLKRSYEYLRFENEENLRTTSLKRDVLVLKKTEFILGLARGITKVGQE